MFFSQFLIQFEQTGHTFDLGKAEVVELISNYFRLKICSIVVSVNVLQISSFTFL